MLAFELLADEHRVEMEPTSNDSAFLAELDRQNCEVHEQAEEVRARGRGDLADAMEIAEADRTILALEARGLEM